MALSERQSSAIAHKKRMAQVSKDLDLEHRRVGVAVGSLMTDGVWSNKTSEWYCLACEAFAPGPTVHLSTLDTEATCAFCRRPLTAADDRRLRA